jgi:hypothetical protein
LCKHLQSNEVLNAEVVSGRITEEAAEMRQGGSMSLVLGGARSIVDSTQPSGGREGRRRAASVREE